MVVALQFSIFFFQCAKHVNERRIQQHVFWIYLVTLIVRNTKACPTCCFLLLGRHMKNGWTNSTQTILLPYRLWGECSVPAEYIQVATICFLSGSCSVETSGISKVHYGGCTAECKITAGHWPISDHFSKVANQFQHGAFTLYTRPIKFMKNWKNGRPFQISYFAVCTDM